MSEYHKRSMMKTISWRIIATLTTMTIVFLFTGKVALAAGVGMVEVITKMLFYYLHERTWNRIIWGKLKHPLANLAVKKELAPEDMEIIRQRLKDLGYL